MTDDHPTEFFCPGCGSRYKVVRVKADADLPYRLIHCKVCKQPLTPADGEYALKYFLIEKANKHNGVDLRMSHAPKDETSKPKVRADASGNALPKGIAGHEGPLSFVTAARNKARTNARSS